MVDGFERLFAQGVSLVIPEFEFPTFAASILIAIIVVVIEATAIGLGVVATIASSIDAVIGAAAICPGVVAIIRVGPYRAIVVAIVAGQSIEQTAEPAAPFAGGSFAITVEDIEQVVEHRMFLLCGPGQQKTPAASIGRARVLPGEKVLASVGRRGFHAYCRPSVRPNVRGGGYSP
jgi:hypothetical protein